ncbi:MAG: excinuclease ABC subunit UvrA [Clostridiales bacterium]|jgi:excinuclease ABC subunit A|nr:excinuclease ABC subunit UvrA [Clostridiales bacterium]
MRMDKIIIKGARENNLKNIDVEIPRDRFVVLTGVSGSGKSSLAFETIYAEGQRRYVESLSSYARQFLGQMDKPDVDHIDGLSPAISIDQKSTSHNPRSTVGTVTEIYDYLRLLFARVGTPHCPNCGTVIEKQTVDQIVDQLMDLAEGARLQILAPVVRARKGEHQKLLADAAKQGYVRARVDGSVYELSETITLDKNKKHTIEIVVDRLVIRPGIESRLTEAIEAAARIAGGIIGADTGSGTLIFSENFACPECGFSMEEIEPRMFSFNNPAGACPECSGLGYLMKFDPELVVPDPTKSLAEGAVNVMGWGASGNDLSVTAKIFQALAKQHGFSLNTPFGELPENIRNIILYGDGTRIDMSYVAGGIERTYSYTYEGVITSLTRRYRETSSDYAKQEYEALMTNNVCPVCAGKRLKPEVLAVTVGSRNVSELTGMTVADFRAFFDTVRFTPSQTIIAERILAEIRARSGFLIDVGLQYLTLARMAATLSGGESQRIRLATQIGSGLVGVVYILDEPSIGLHQRDNGKLLRTLLRLRDLGNTLIVVEHDQETMLAADYIVDIGPEAGENGGKVVYAGDVAGLLKTESLTGDYLSGRKFIPVPKVRRKPAGFLGVRGASENNLKNVNVDIPLGVVTCVTGVSGSGKSSLVNSVLYKRLARDLNRAKGKPGRHADITGIDQLDKVIDIDQSPIGRTPRSNPATYTGLFDLIRDVFANTVEAKTRGYKKGRFSFNVKGGRCEACGGDGIIKIEMHFLPDVYVPCEVCGGKRYNRETLEVRYKGKSIADVLGMTVDDACVFFENLPRLKSKVDTLRDVGLGYVKLGQPSTTLSGGEAQRVKLATELSKRATGRTLYVLDEPTTGLSAADVHKLTNILQKLAEGGNTLVVIEHNLDVIKCADYIIDLGPEGGDMGGEIVAAGTPEAVAARDDSFTGQYLRRALELTGSVPAIETPAGG